MRGGVSRGGRSLWGGASGAGRDFRRGGPGGDGGGPRVAAAGAAAADGGRRRPADPLPLLALLQRAAALRRARRRAAVRMYSRTIAIIGGFLILASGAGELYRQKPRSRSLQSTGQVFLGIYLICQAYSLQHSKEDRLAYLNHLLGGELALQLLFILYGLLALAFLSGYYVRVAAQVLAVLLPLAILLIDSNIGYWHDSRRVEFWNQMKLIGQNVGIFGAVVILATDG
ncbi:transmembrane protein 101 isoform X5 [Calonectris borealis]|uniref:transmembrane protein 101 isoform X5 n=1 Tax=Calonectris borealis TaxID=1323832 RepID=UPI003F4B68D8